MAHSTVHTLFPVYAAQNRKLFSLLLNEAVEHKSFKSVSSRFQAQVSYKLKSASLHMQYFSTG